MRLSKRQLKKIIREEYSHLKRRGLIRESVDQRAQVDGFVQENIESYGPEVSEPFYYSLARAQGLGHFKAMMNHDEDLEDTFTDFDHDCNMAGIEVNDALGYVREKYAVPSAIEQSARQVAEDPNVVQWEPGSWYGGSL